MKAKDYKSITNILESQNKGKKFYDFMDMEDVKYRIKEDIVPLPKQYFNNIIKLIKGEKWVKWQIKTEKQKKNLLSLFNQY